MSPLKVPQLGMLDDTKCIERAPWLRRGPSSARSARLAAERRRPPIRRSSPSATLARKRRRTAVDPKAAPPRARARSMTRRRRRPRRGRRRGGGSKPTGHAAAADAVAARENALRSTTLGMEEQAALQRGGLRRGDGFERRCAPSEGSRAEVLCAPMNRVPSPPRNLARRRRRSAMRRFGRTPARENAPRRRRRGSRNAPTSGTVVDDGLAMQEEAR